MKKITWFFMSLMLLLGVGTASAQPSAPVLITPLNGDAVEPGQPIKFVQNADYVAMNTVLLYTFDATASLDIDMDDLGDIMENGPVNGVYGTFLMAAAASSDDPDDPTIVANWMPTPTIPSDASGTVTLRARVLSMTSGQFSGITTATYTVGAATPVPAPTFSKPSGSVPTGTKITVNKPVIQADGYDYDILYVLDNPDFDFTQYKCSDNSMCEDGPVVPYNQIYKSPIAITKNTTITVITMKYDGWSEKIAGWSQPVTATYTIGGEVAPPAPKPTAPTFNPDGGEIASGVKITLTNGTESEATPLKIYYNFNDDNGASITKFTTQEALDKDVKLQYTATVFLYAEPGIEITEAKKIQALTANVNEDGLITWSDVTAKEFTIAADPEPIAAPTYSPESGSTVAPGDEITFNVPTEYQNYIVYLLYTTDATAFASATTYAEKIALVEEVMDTDDAGDPTYTGPIMTAGMMNGNWLMPCKIPDDAEEGALTLQAFLFIQEANIVSEIATASYTVEGTVAPVPTPILTPGNGSAVKEGSTVKVSFEEDDTDEYWLYYVIDYDDFDFTQYTTDEAVEEAGAKETYGTIKITKACTIKVAACRVEQGWTNTITAWSDPVTATYTIEAPTPTNDVPMPVFNPNGGAVLSGAKVILTNGTENEATPKPIYYNFKANDAAETAFSGLTTKAALDAEQTKSEFMRRAIAYPEGGIELTADKTISAATADIDAEGNVTWSTVITKEFTIGTAPVKPAAPTFTPDGGNLQRGTAIKLNKGDNNCSSCEIYYSFGSSNDVFNVATVTELGMKENAGTLIQYSSEGIDIDADTTIRAAVVRTNADETLTWSDPTVKSFTLVGEAPQTVATPVIKPANDAVVHMGDMVTITCATDNAEIYYTTDGSAPYTTDANGEAYTGIAEKAIRYTEPFALEQTMLVRQGNSFSLRIRAVAKNGTAIKTAATGYVVYPNAPTFSPVAGEVVAGTKVAIKCVPDSAKIYYTIDGTTPTEGSTVYTDSIEITAAMTIKAIAVLGQYDASASASYTIKEAPVVDPEDVTLTFNPASGTTVEDGTAVTITANANVEIFYMMFESEAAAKAAEWDQDKAESYSEEMKPVLSKEKNTLKVAYALEGAEALVDTFFYATYTVNEQPAITLTFNPASGSEVKDSTTVTVTASRETEIYYNLYADSAAAAADTLFIMNAKKVNEDGMPVITKNNTYLRCGVYDRNEMKFFYAAYTVKSEDPVDPTANEGKELAGVNVYPNPNSGMFYIELPVAATVDVFASNGVLVKSFTAPAGKATLSLDHSGIYFVRIVGEGRATVKRVIVR